MKFSEDMNFSIWDWPYSQDETYYVANSWPYDLYLNPQLDVIEEDALNEKSCIQVLKTLIAKADTEILEIEEEKVMLQSELALADEKWHAMCFTTLIQKITCLDKLIQDLKNGNVNDVLHLGIQQMHPKPAERIHEVLGALLQDYFSQSDEQNEASLADHNSPCSNAQKVASTQPMEKILNSSTSNIVCGISVTAKRTLNSLSSGSGITVDEGVASAISKDSAAEPLRDEASTCSFRTLMRIGIGSEDFRADEVEELSNTQECIVSSTIKEVKGVNLSEIAKFQGSKVVDIKQEVEDFSMNQKYKEAVTTQSIEKETKSQLLETKRVSIGSPWGVKGQGALLSEANHNVGESLLVLYNQKDKNVRKTQIKIEPQEYYPPKTQVTALAESNSSLSLQLRNWEQRGRQWPLYANMVREPSLTEELGLKSPPPKKLKKQRKYGSGYNTANSYLGNKNSDESQLALVVAKSADSTPQTKISLNLPVMKEHENLRDYQMRLTKSRGTSKDVQDTGFPSSDNLAADLKRMTKTQLRALAKQHKLKKWYNLKKAQLQQLLHLSLQGKAGDM